MSNPFLGEIRLLPFNFAPRGWMTCSGQLVSIAQNDALFALIGTIYGGDGQTTFALPDLRGRLPIHQGQGPGLSNYVIGQAAGSESVTLVSSQLPSHTHTLIATTAGATSLTPGNALLPGAVSGDTFYVNTTAGNTMAPMSNQMLSQAGGSQPHDNTMPTLTLQYCIAVEGIFPSRI